MRLIAPSFYTSFSCIADRCIHSCCRGWEIDIDEDTLELYRSLEGPFGERLRENISCEDGTAGFILKEDESCPFLNENGLCDIILTLGEEALSDICAMHPRYTVEFDTFLSQGQGLCCEEAARLACLEKDLHMETVYEEDPLPCTPEEEDYILWEERITGILRDTAKTFREKETELGIMAGLNAAAMSGRYIGSVLERMEFMEEEWYRKIAGQDLSPVSDELTAEEERALSNVLFCFAVRHMPEDFPEHDVLRGLRISLFLTELILRIRAKLSPEDRGIQLLADTVRAVSSEVEYSEENMDMLRGVFGESCII